VKPDTRQSEILSFLRAAHREFRVEELAGVLRVSPLTIRRDLQVLAGRGAILRTHGGCRAVGRAALESEYHQKVAHNFDLKRAIARAAAEQVSPGDTLVINDGSTTFHLAAELRTRGSLTIYTNSLAMISELSEAPEITIYILGGRYNRELYSLQGSFTELILESCHADVAFIGADAVTDDGKCMADSPEEAGLTRSMLRTGRRKILLADHTKCRASGYFAYGSLQDYDLWITTAGVPPDVLKGFQALVDIIQVEYPDG